MTDAGTPAPRLTIAVARKLRRVEIVIGDNGPGVDPAIAATLFTPFVTTKSAGLGLGLVICRDIVAGFGGELSLRPARSGARFVISLKAAP
jgi:two-component system C4-dicarboxylate transport sensor histidine kinase DctB